MADLQSKPPQTRARERRLERQAALRKLGYADHPTYPASAHWAGVKAQYWASDLPKDCALCGEDEALHLHHVTYERIGREELTDLRPLCPTCHALIHALERRGDADLDFTDLLEAVPKRDESYVEEENALRQKGHHGLADKKRDIRMGRIVEKPKIRRGSRGRRR